jgi:tetratricopeptide (TPR) repeat protein
MLIAAAAVAGLPAAWRAGGRRRAGAVLLVFAAVLLPQVLAYQPRMDLVHYNLARLEDERGNPQAAEEHYKAAFILNPHDFLACLNLGNHAARQGDWATALRLYDRAERIEPASDDVQSNLGGVYLALGRTQEAEAHLDRALALNAQNRTALHNKALLLAGRGDLAGARELNRRLLEIEPQNPAALRLRDRLSAGS